MDKEDESRLFDTERVERELSLEFVKQFQLALTAYTQSGRQPTDKDRFDTELFALQEATAELMARHNRILWQAVQRLVSGKPD